MITFSNTDEYWLFKELSEIADRLTVVKPSYFDAFRLELQPISSDACKTELLRICHIVKSLDVKDQS